VLTLVVVSSPEVQGDSEATETHCDDAWARCGVAALGSRLDAVGITTDIALVATGRCFSVKGGS
jgi:hypothetical protein